MAGKGKATEPAGPGQRAGLSGEPAEVTDEPAEVISRAAAIDVAKDSGMVCTRVPHEASPHRRIQRVWQVSARYRRRGGADGRAGVSRASSGS